MVNLAAKIVSLYITVQYVYNSYNVNVVHRLKHNICMFEVNVTSLKDRKIFNRQMVIKQFVSNNTNQNKIKLPTYSFFSYMNVMFPSCCWGWALI